MYNIHLLAVFYLYWKLMSAIELLCSSLYDRGALNAQKAPRTNVMELYSASQDVFRIQ